MTNNLILEKTNLSTDSKLSFDLQHYGHIINDMTLVAGDGVWRMKIISLDSVLYQLIMHNGSINNIIKLED